MIISPVFAQEGEYGLAWYKHFFATSKTDGSIEKEFSTLKLSLAQAEENQDATAKARILKHKGLLHLTRTHDYDSAMSCFIGSLMLEDSVHLKEERIFTYLAIAQVFEVVGDYSKSADYLEKALHLNEEKGDVDNLAYILNKQGKVNAARGNVAAAQENFEHVMRYEDQLSDQHAIAEANVNLGLLNQQMGDYKNAYDRLKNALTIYRSLGDRTNEAQSLSEIAEAYRLMKNFSKALDNHVAALEIREMLKDKRGLAETYNNIGALYFEQGNIERAVANLQLGLQAANETQDVNEQRKSNDYLSQCARALNDFQSALKFRDQYVSLTEFIQNEKNSQKITETQNRYEIEKTEMQIDKLERVREQREREIKEQEKFRNVLFVIIGLIVVIVLLVVYLYLQQQRSNVKLKIANEKVSQQNIELQELNATKDKFFSILSHDLKGPLNSLTSFSGLLINHLDSLSKEDIQMLARDLERSVKNLFALLENLLEWSRSQTGNMDFKPELFDLGEILETNKQLLEAQAAAKQISIVNKNTGKMLVNVHKHSVNTVVRNLVSNAIKFTPPQGTITLNLEQNKNEVIVSIADNGVGMGPEIMEKLFRLDTKHSTKGTADEKGTGLGLILCKEFIEKNGGKIWVKSEVGKGSVFSFTLPLLDYTSVPKEVTAAMSEK